VREQFALVAHEEAQEVVLVRGQRDRLAVDRQPVLLEVA
jgi:hypothetical protein